MATWYRAEGGVETRLPADGKVFTYQELDELVGKCEDAVYRMGQALLVDEDAVIMGKPINVAATALLHKAHPHRSATLLFGDVLLVTTAELGDTDDDDDDEDEDDEDEDCPVCRGSGSWDGNTKCSVCDGRGLLAEEHMYGALMSARDRALSDARDFINRMDDIIAREVADAG